MDFGALTMDSDSVGSEPDNRNPNKNHGSGFLLKQDRSGFGEDHIHNWRSSKTCRTTATDDAFEAPRTMSYQQHQGTGTTLLRSNSRISSPGDGIGNGSTQNMLNFSTPNNNNNNAGEEAPFSSENGGLVERSNQNPPFRLYQQPPSYIRNAGIFDFPFSFYITLNWLYATSHIRITCTNKLIKRKRSCTCDACAYYSRIRRMVIIFRFGWFYCLGTNLSF